MNNNVTYLKQVWDKVGQNLELLGLQVENLRNKEKASKTITTGTNWNNSRGYIFKNWGWNSCQYTDQYTSSVTNSICGRSWYKCATGETNTHHNKPFNQTNCINTSVDGRSWYKCATAPTNKHQNKPSNQTTGYQYLIKVIQIYNSSHKQMSQETFKVDRYYQ